MAENKSQPHGIQSQFHCKHKHKKKIYILHIVLIKYKHKTALFVWICKHTQKYINMYSKQNSLKSKINIIRHNTMVCAIYIIS